MQQLDHPKAPSGTELDGVVDAIEDFVVAVRRFGAEGGLSRTAASTLSTLHRGGPVRLTVLAALEAVTQPTMTGLVTRLEAAGLVARTPDPTDGRAVLIALTDAGRAAYRARRRQLRRALAREVQALDGDDVDRLVSALPALRRLSQITGSDHPEES